MSSSLREQLIAAGLVSQKQAREATPNTRPPQQSKKLPPPLSAAALAAQRAQAEKFARDQALNRKRQEKAERKALLAQLQQMIEHSALPRIESDDYYNFVDAAKIKRIAVNAGVRAQIQSGEVLIVRCGPGYRLLPSAAAERIREREPTAIVPPVAAEPQAPGAAEDTYKEYVVPDDLMW
jgi:hypothetical protein